MNETIIHMPEDFAIDEALKFREELDHLINEESKKNFILDFSSCTFVDSTGLGVLVSIYKKCEALNGTLKLKSMNPDVMKVFTLTRLDKVFKFM